MARPPRKAIAEEVASEEELPSKSQRKRDMEALQKLGREIIELKPALREKLPLSEDMLDAIEEMERITSNEARRRHMQYVGKVMRSEDIEGIKQAFVDIERQHDARDRDFHRLEKLRDRLIEEGDGALDDALAQLPGIEISQLRQLIRNAQRERSQGKAPSSARKLFKLMREYSTTA